MKVKCLLLFLLNATILLGQDIHLKGVIVDKQTRQPISFATISVHVVKKSIKANTRGVFEIVSAKIAFSDSLFFSCVGYQMMKMKVKDFPKNDTIELLPTIYRLNEVKVNSEPQLLIKVGSKKKKGYEAFQTHPGRDMFMFMEGSKNVKGIIQSVGFFLTKGHGMFKGGDVTAPFQIKLFSVDTRGVPGKELTKDSIVVSAKKEWSWFDADISAYNIQNPDSGFFVSFSPLPYTRYKCIEKLDTIIISYTAEFENMGEQLPQKESTCKIFNTPRLCVTDDEFIPSRSYTYEYSLQNNKLHWEKLYHDQSYMIRAAIAPE